MSDDSYHMIVLSRFEAEKRQLRSSQVIYKGREATGKYHAYLVAFPSAATRDKAAEILKAEGSLCYKVEPMAPEAAT